MVVPARISIVTLGVADVARAAAFYEALGWKRCASSMAEIAWFRTADSYLGLFGWVNVETREAVDAALAEAEVAGGEVLKPGTVLPFGYGGYFADPDGHPWEVCYNQDFPFVDDGRILIE